MSSINSLYLLTDMTGRSSGSERTMIVATFEMKWRSFWIALIALVPGGILSALFYPLLNVWALLWLVLVEGAAFFLLEKRSAEGLKLRTYQSMFDKKRSNLDTFYLCDRPLEVRETSFGIIQQITAKVDRGDETSNILDIFDQETTEARK